MKKRTFIMGLAALALAFGSAGVIGGAALNTNSGAIMTKAAVGDDIKIGEGTYLEAYRTGFEIPAAKTSYASKITISSSDGDGLSWEVNLGNVSTTSMIDGEKSVLLRHAKGSKNKSYLTNTSSLEDSIAAFQFSYKVTNVSLTFDVEYSNDGTNWNTLETVTAAKKDTVYSYSAELPSAISNFKMRVIMNSFPTSKCDLIIDNVVFAKTDTTPSISIGGGSDITLKNGGSKAVDLVIKNLPEDGSISVEVTDTSIATAAISDATMSINGLKVGETAFTISMKDGAANEVATCTGKITVSIAVTGVTLISDFEDDATLKVGSTHELLVEVEPNAASQDIVWTVSDSNAATVSSEGVLTIVEKTSDNLVTVTATSAADSTASASLDFYVSNEFSISDLISKDGTSLPNGLASGSTVVSTKGTVTAKEGKNVYVQSGNAGLELYAGYNDDTLTSLKVGDGVRVSGTITLYNGITELASPSIVIDDAVKEDVAPLELTEDNMVAVNTSRLVTAHNAKCLASATVSGSSNIEVKFQLSDDTAFTLYLKGSSISKISTFGNFAADNYYDITGLFCLYNKSGTTTSQIVINEGCSYYAAGTEEVKQFIADYITGKDGVAAEGDTCKAKYDAAKAAYDKLSDNAKTLFTTSSDYASAYETYTYWETHQNDASAVKLVNGSNTTNWTNIAVIAGAILLASCASVYFFLNKKKQDR